MRVLAPLLHLCLHKKAALVQARYNLKAFLWACYFGLSCVWMSSFEAKTGKSELHCAELVSNTVCLHYPVDDYNCFGRLHHATLWNQMGQSAKGSICAFARPCHPIASSLLLLLMEPCIGLGLFDLDCSFVHRYGFTPAAQHS